MPSVSIAFGLRRPCLKPVTFLMKYENEFALNWFR